MTSPLYNTAILRLAASIPHQERLASPHATVQRVSPVCGSRVTVDLDLDADGKVSRFGQEVRACALGQASAAILGQDILGKTTAQLISTRDALAAFLKGEVDTPGDWPGLELFAPARPHKGRHGSIRLAFEAAADAALAAKQRAPAA